MQTFDRNGNHHIVERLQVHLHDEIYVRGVDLQMYRRFPEGFVYIFLTQTGFQKLLEYILLRTRARDHF